MEPSTPGTTAPPPAPEAVAGAKRPAEAVPDMTPPENKLPRPTATLPPTLSSPTHSAEALQPPPQMIQLPPISTAALSSLSFPAMTAAAAVSPLPATSPGSLSLSSGSGAGLSSFGQAGTPPLGGGALPSPLASVNNLQSALLSQAPLPVMQQPGAALSSSMQGQMPQQAPHVSPQQSLQSISAAIAKSPVIQAPPPAAPSTNISMSAGAGYVVRAPGQPGQARAPAQEQKKQLKETDALEYLNQVKQQFGDNPEIYNKFLDIMKDFKSHAIDTQKVIERVSKLFAGHQSLILGFNTFLPSGYKIEVRQQGAPTKKPAPEFDHAYSYVSKIKQRFANQQEVYQKFLQILQRYKEEGFAIAQVKAQVAELFNGHEDLLGEFGNFLPDPSNRAPQVQKQKKPKAQPKGVEGKMPAEVKAVSRKIGMHKVDDAEAAKEHALFERLKKRLSAQGPNSYADFLKCLSLYVQDVLTANELTTVLEDMMCGPGVKEVYEEFKVFLGFRLDTGNKYKSNIPMSEIDFSSSQTSGVSYRSLPKDYPLPQCSGRTELCDSVLNDEWVSVPSGSEDYSYTHYRKNQYEESLFKCEDDRFELDMLIETNASAVRVIEPLMEEAVNSRGNKVSISGLKPIHFKAIERVYGDHGAEIVEHIKRAPRVALNVVLPRLCQKDEEWRKARRDMNKIWREVYKDNYYKSLDHRSFYFKQVDKKGLSPKAFLQEMRSAQEAALMDPALSPLLSFLMPDLDIHTDILMVISKSAASELYEVAEARVRKFFTVVLHVFLGLRQRSADEIKGRQRLSRKERREAGRRDQEKGSGYLSLRTRKLEGLKDEEGKEEGEEDDDDKDGKGDEKSDKGNDDAMDEDDKEPSAKKGDRDEGDDQPEGDEDEDDEDDEDDLWQAVHCMHGFSPLNVGVGKESAFDTTILGSTASPSVKLLFGNMHLYVFFRLYQKLYQRLADARALSIAQDERLAADRVAPKKEAGTGDGDEASMADGEEGAEGEKKETTYAKFMEMLISLVEGQLDNGKFEDDCRVLLGTNSYELYTLDKVVEKLLGQAQSLTSEASAQSGSRLLALHEYEQLHSGEINNSLYRANAAVLTDTDSCYAFYADSANGGLFVQLIDYKDSHKVDMRFERRREDFLEELLAPLDPAAGDAVRSPFLKRSVRGQKLEVDALVEAHGLELMFREDRICYAKHTEDSMFKSSRPATSKYAVKSRAERVKKWQVMRLEKIPAEAAEEAARIEAEEAERAAAEAEAEEEEEEEKDEDEDGEGEGEGDGGDGDGEDGMDEDDDGEGEGDDGEGDVDGDGDEDGDEDDGAERGGLESLMQAGEEDGRGAMEEDEGDDDASREGAEARDEDDHAKEAKEERVSSRGSRGRSAEKEQSKEEDKAKDEEAADQQEEGGSEEAQGGGRGGSGGRRSSRSRKG